MGNPRGAPIIFSRGPKQKSPYIAASRAQRNQPYLSYLPYCRLPRSSHMFTLKRGSVALMLSFFVAFDVVVSFLVFFVAFDVVFFHRFRSRRLSSLPTSSFSTTS